MKSKKDTWQIKIIQVPHFYAACPYCEFEFERDPTRWLPLFCGGCGKRLFPEEDDEDEEEQE